MRAREVVTAIDGVATAGLDIDTIIGRLRGAPGTQVSLEVRRVGAEGPNRILVVRGLIQPRGVDVAVRLGTDGLIAEANGLWPILDFDLGKPVPLAPIAKDEFRASGDDQTMIRAAARVQVSARSSIRDLTSCAGYGSIDARSVQRLCDQRITLTFPSLLSQRNAPAARKRQQHVQRLFTAHQRGPTSLRGNVRSGGHPASPDDPRAPAHSRP